MFKTFGGKMKIIFEREGKDQTEIHLVKVSDEEGKTALIYPEIPAMHAGQ